VRTVGIDFASQPKATAASVIEWSSSGARVIELYCGVDDGAVLDLVARGDKVGIDVPLGWPVAFATAVGAHAMGESWPSTYQHADGRSFQLRRTDLFVRREIPALMPLSVAADKIAIPAMRAAGLLSRLSPPMARDGSGVVVEVYPAAALARWGLGHRGYKGPKRTDERRRLVAEFVRRLGDRLDISTQHRALCERLDDAFDAIVAAYVARAHEVGLVESIPHDDRELAKREGWIAIPLQGSLERL
jgi:predicted nuclease with RNAse H fold